MINRAHAVQLIEELLRAEESEYADEGRAVALGISKITEHRLGWIIHYQSRAFILSGDHRDALIGTGPYLVDRYDGSIHFIPGTDYMGGLWEEDYKQRIKPIHTVEQDPLGDVPFATEIREALESEGRIAAIRLLRRRATPLLMSQANLYVTALAANQRPSDELIELTRPPEPFCSRLGIRTITGPNPTPRTA
ncbi:YrhB domain-containing protein [Actinomadura sp. HBU206391]|uniref:YrhB domain-containing protein n=1 Tax=Actinomadura sp. HBU206391 TaxID=2731692 RepID=UPI00165040D8|nr:YrhB domain-containing protein [Actinomadura sp. HBU206391]MBC6461891.1 hypothetical protein [Actinomadura sp. HBU206391]